MTTFDEFDGFDEDVLLEQSSNSNPPNCHHAATMNTPDFGIGTISPSEETPLTPPSDTSRCMQSDHTQYLQHMRDQPSLDDLAGLVTTQYEGRLGQRRKRGRVTGVVKRKKQIALEKKKTAPLSRAARQRKDLVAQFGEDKVASDGDLKGVTRQLADGSIVWLEPSSSQWLPAAPHEDFREEFIKIDQARYAPYESLPESGVMGLDVTSNCDIGSQNTWTFDKEGFMKIVDAKGNHIGRTGKPPRDMPLYPESGYLTHNGMVMLDPDDRPVLNWSDIPLCFSSKLEGGRLEALRRVFPWLKISDFRARMPRHWMNEQGQLTALGGISTFGQRMSRFRDSVGCGPWIERGGTTSKKRKLVKEPVENGTETGNDDIKPSPRRIAFANASGTSWNPININPPQEIIDPRNSLISEPISAPLSIPPSHMPTNPCPPMAPRPSYSNISWNPSSGTSIPSLIDFRLMVPQNEIENKHVRNALRLTKADFAAYHGIEAPTLPDGNCYTEHYRFLHNTHTAMWANTNIPAPMLLGVQFWPDSFEKWIPPILSQEQLKYLLLTPFL